MPSYFQIGERKFALGTFERNHYSRQVEKMGAKITRPDPLERVVLRVQSDQAKILAGHYHKNAKAILDLERNLDLEQEKALQREISISATYHKIRADHQLSALQAPALFDPAD